MICVQSLKQLRRALLACWERAGCLTARHRPAKPPNITPEHVRPLPVLSFCSPVSAFNKICDIRRNPSPSTSEMLKQMAKPGLPFPAGEAAVQRAAGPLARCRAGGGPCRRRQAQRLGAGLRWGCGARQRGATGTQRGLPRLARAGERAPRGVSLRRRAPRSCSRPCSQAPFGSAVAAAALPLPSPPLPAGPRSCPAAPAPTRPGGCGRGELWSSGSARPAPESTPKRPGQTIGRVCSGVCQERVPTGQWCHRPGQSEG